MADHRLVAGPVRTCVGCRARAAKADLLRVVAVRRGEGLALLPDPAGTAPGRGAHVHPTPECVGLALRRRAFVRALRVPGGLEAERLEACVRQWTPVDDRRPVGERKPGARSRA